MELKKANRKLKCAGEVLCNEKVEFCIKFSKNSINLCEKCARNLFSQLGSSLVPKSIKNKFNYKE